MAQPLVPDTSVVIDGRVSARIKSGELQGRRIVVPEAVVAELEAQANHGREIGLKGLEELLPVTVVGPLPARMGSAFAGGWRLAYFWRRGSSPAAGERK